MLGWPEQSILQEESSSHAVLHSLANFSSLASRDYQTQFFNASGITGTSGRVGNIRFERYNICFWIGHFFLRC